LDIGASTGGFSDVCLKQNAKFVYAIDVGSNQLHKSLKNHPQIKSYENLHFKDMELNLFDEHIDFIVADVSFISLTKLIDKLRNLFNYKYQCIFLIKPQFELSPKEIKLGKVISEELTKKAVNNVINYANKYNYEVFGVIPSPIKGNKLGIQEYLIYMEKK
jgi:23S rRNA (cytidine1920-2'-O)/16S rRNA (cytidine1409-2'-O)-methyltransferase